MACSHFFAMMNDSSASGYFFSYLSADDYDVSKFASSFIKDFMMNEASLQ